MEALCLNEMKVAGLNDVYDVTLPFPHLVPIHSLEALLLKGD